MSKEEKVTANKKTSGLVVHVWDLKTWEAYEVLGPCEKAKENRERKRNFFPGVSV